MGEANFYYFTCLNFQSSSRRLVVSLIPRRGTRGALLRLTAGTCRHTRKNSLRVYTTIRYILRFPKIEHNLHPSFFLVVSALPHEYVCSSDFKRICCRPPIASCWFAS